MTTQIRDWPGFMRKSTAARYCDMTVVAFEKSVAVGEIPMPIRINGEERWSRREIDARAARSENLGIHDWREDSPLYAKS
jgi:hypothetical protein